MTTGDRASDRRRSAVRLLARAPIRVRVAVAYSLVMALLLAAAGGGLYLALGATLRTSIDDGLRARSADLVALADEAGARTGDPSPLAERGESIAQVLDLDGRVLDASAALRSTPLLDAATLRRARRGTVLLDRPTVVRPVDGEDTTRLLARPATQDGRPVIVVVGASLEPVEDAQHRLAELLLIGGPIVLLLASVAGYGAAAGALRPMERMRRAAASIRAARSGTRLEVPPAGDELSRLASTLNGMLDRLDDAFRHERAFVDDASHELRTPLALVKGELELAQRPGATADELRAAVASAAEEHDRLVRLAEDLLVLARAEETAAPTSPDRPTAAELAVRASDELRDTEAIIVATDGADVRIPGDRAALHRIAGNLARNAADAGATRIELVVRRRRDAVELHVLDDGPGFPEAFLPRAFERFARADEARARGGTGLGLAIVRALAEARGGTAVAENRPDGGADVAVVLPLRRG